MFRLGHYCRGDSEPPAYSAAGTGQLSRQLNVRGLSEAAGHGCGRQLEARPWSGRAGIVFCHGPARLLDSWQPHGRRDHASDVPQGQRAGRVVIHEIPGITPAVIAFAEQVAARGFTVVLPSLFGREEAPATVRESLRSIARVCVSREFSLFALGRTSPVATWLRSLARELHAELDGPGVGPSACA
jgi:Dienelactone hydrolase family